MNNGLKKALTEIPEQPAELSDSDRQGMWTLFPVPDYQKMWILPPPEAPSIELSIHDRQGTMWILS
jgi:hypothetical protein